MRAFLRMAVAACLCVAVPAYAQSNTFTKVRYNGGTIPSKVSQKDWDNKLTVTSDNINFKLKDGQSLDIPTKKVTGLSYGQEAHRRVGTMVALAVLVSPVALFGLFHKTRLHYIGIDYTDAQGKNAGLLLQGDKDNYRAILQALASSTGQPVAVADKDREFVPTQVKTSMAKDTGPEKALPAPAEQRGSIVLDSNPAAAEVYVDSAFVGNTPAALKVLAGKHMVRLVLKGYQDWSKELTVLADSEVKLVAAMEKVEAQPANTQK